MVRVNIIMILVLLSGLGFAQKNNVQSAANSFKYKEYAEAKKYIDLAAKHVKTANDPKMWYYRGRIYLAIYNADNSKLDPEAIEKSVVSLTTCIDVDERKMYKDSSSVYLMNAAIGCFIAGINSYKEKNYERANMLYSLVLKCLDYDKNKDLARNNVSEKTIYLNLYYAAFGANDQAKSKEYLQKLIDMNYNDPNIYIYMSALQLEEKDTASALSTLGKGRDRFYDDKGLILQQVSLSIKAGKSDELLNKLNDDIGYDDGNSTLYFVRGILHEKKGNIEEALKDYKETIELNPAHFMAHYYLGAIYFNMGAEIMNKAKEIKNNDLYTKEKTKAEEQFKLALPYFEIAHEIDAKDTDVLTRLARLYARTGNDEKYKEMKAKLDAMQ
ncbi:MAG TPA: tetratricopeptide repeat protein [Flavobacteriales bacterium]|nr:tetratricopeptide repeat protein [Flavobacteriales bacterium]